MSIQLFAPHYRIDEVLLGIRECLEKGWTGLGFKTLEFEKAWTEYTGLPYAHMVNSGTAGLHLAVHILKDYYRWQDGDEIITTPMTFVSTNHAILYERLKPVFADIDSYLCLNPDSVESRITPKTRAVIFVGMGGNSGQLKSIAEICHEYDLQLIIDAAHMAGTRINGRHVGSEADVCVFSFHAVKNLPTADSGMICFKNADLDKKVRKLTWLGIDKDTYQRTKDKSAYKWKYGVNEVGFKYHGNSIMAAIGLVSLKYLDQDNAYRRQIADWYDCLFSSTKNIDVIYPHFNCESSRHLYQVAVSNRDEIILALNSEGIFPGVHYRDNIQYPMYAYAEGTCPVARNYSERVLSLPIHVGMTYQDVFCVGSTLIKIIEKIGG